MKRNVLSISLAAALALSGASMPTIAADGSGSCYMEVTETQESEVVSEYTGSSESSGSSEGGESSAGAASGSESGGRPMIGGGDEIDKTSSGNMGDTTGGSAQPGKTSRIVKVTRIRTIKTGGTATVKNTNVASVTKSAGTKKKSAARQATAKKSSSSAKKRSSGAKKTSSTAKKSSSTAKKTSSTAKTSKKSTKKKSSKK